MLSERWSTKKKDITLMDTMEGELKEEVGIDLEPRKETDDDILVGNGSGEILRSLSGEKQGNYVVGLIKRPADILTGKPLENEHLSEETQTIDHHFVSKSFLLEDLLAGKHSTEVDKWSVDIIKNFCKPWPFVEGEWLEFTEEALRGKRAEAEAVVAWHDEHHGPLPSQPKGKGKGNARRSKSQGSALRSRCTGNRRRSVSFDSRAFNSQEGAEEEDQKPNWESSKKMKRRGQRSSQR